MKATCSQSDAIMLTFREPLLNRSTGAFSLFASHMFSKAAGPRKCQGAWSFLSKRRTTLLARLALCCSDEGFQEPWAEGDAGWLILFVSEEPSG